MAQGKRTDNPQFFQCPDSRSVNVGVVFICPVKYAGNPLFPGKIEKSRKEVFFTEIAAFRGIVPHSLHLKLIHLDYNMFRSQLSGNLLCRIQIAGRMEHCIECHRIDGGFIFSSVVTGDFKKQAAVHTAGKGNAYRPFPVLIHHLIQLICVPVPISHLHLISSCHAAAGADSSIVTVPPHPLSGHGRLR